jgi:ribosomal protein L11 methyltransferase
VHKETTDEVKDVLEISFLVKHSEIDEVLEKLVSIGLYSTYYDAPYEVTVDSNGYGYFEKEEELVNLKVYPESDDLEECNKYIEDIMEVIGIKNKEHITLSQLKDEGWQQPFEPVDLENGWIIAEPTIEVEGLKKINFESQGSFGTGIHETTQDLLRFILDFDFTGLKVLDLGTGSGILSIAAGLKNAEEITALDIRDVTEEVYHNAALNSLSNVKVVVADVTEKNFGVNDKFDVVFINIGGEETLASMELIDSVLKKDGKLLVSGLVDWSSDNICDEFKAKGYSLIKSTKTNEWVTLVFTRLV